VPDTILTKEHLCRSSACAEASLREEMTRMRGMSVEERIRAALALGSKFAGLRPAPLNRQRGETS